MCITAECPDPTECGVWWRDDAQWRLYGEQTTRKVLSALVQGTPSLRLTIPPSASHPAGASYLIDLTKMEQTNTVSGHKRAIKLVFPPSFRCNRAPGSSSLNDKVSLSMGSSAGSPFMVGFRLHGNSNCLLIIRKGDIAEWAVDGKADAVVNPRRRCISQGGHDGMVRRRTSSAINGPNVERTKGSIRSAPFNVLSEGHKERTTVSASLHRSAGPKLHEALEKSLLLQRASGRGSSAAVITPGFQLPASRVIHASVPKYKGDAVAESCGQLEKTYKSVLAMATANGIWYLAFPAIGCGASGFPVDLAARVAMLVVSSSSSMEGVREIHFLVVGEESVFMEWVMQAVKLFSKGG